MSRKKELLSVLQKSFGLHDFREGQEEIIESVLAGNNTMVYMPTGGGKSLVYQLPTLMKHGMTVVISPLISLMKDQVDKLNFLWIRAELINSTISSSEISDIFEEIQFANISRNPIKFLYITPERLRSRRFLAVIKNTRITSIAIDEAHCISQWGHDFRPTYMKIQGFIQELRGSKEGDEQQSTFPVIALTATATFKVREDIRERLGITEYQEFVRGFDRKNIIIVVREISAKEEKQKKVVEILKKTPGVGIIYCSSRKNVIELSEYLVKKGLKVGSYKGDMSADIREAEQNAFMNDGYKAIVATNAFGMGIDKSDIRFVLHYNLPGSIENYYQEVGRAGRDGKKSFWVVLASYGDTKIQEFFIENTYPSKHEILDVYDGLYKNIALWKGRGTVIQKTYYTLASETGIGNDIKVGSAIKILEKYGILKRGINEAEVENDFRGRGVTLLQEKRQHSHLMVDWQRQEMLKEEGYYKLEQIKRFLFYPSCRKRFILEYFGDTEDLTTLGKNCGVCDFCIEKQDIQIDDVKSIIPTSMYGIVLETVKEYDEKFGATLLAKVLAWSGEKRIIEWNLDTYEHYGVFLEYQLDTIIAIFQALTWEGFLYKKWGKYPVIGLTDVGKVWLYKEKYLKEALEDLNTYVLQQSGKDVFKKVKSVGQLKKTSIPKGQTYQETLQLFRSGKTISDISKKRGFATQTIEDHIVKLYQLWDLQLIHILKLVEFSHLKSVRDFLDSDPILETRKLKTIRQKLQEQGNKKVSYFDIKLALAMIKKKDL